MLGTCLCEDVEFEIVGDISNFYQCHCSQCRKVTGSASNTGFFVSRDQFKWRKGEKSVAQFIKDSGYNSCFCSRCGSSLPNLMRNGEGYWVPAGLLEQETNCIVAAHLHVSSKAEWDSISGEGVRYAEMPDIETLNKALQRTN